MSVISGALLAATLVVMFGLAPALAAGTTGEAGLPKSLLDDNPDINPTHGASGGANYRVDQPAYRQVPAAPPGTMRLELGAPGSDVAVPLPNGPSPPSDLPGRPNTH